MTCLVGLALVLFGCESPTAGGTQADLNLISTVPPTATAGLALAGGVTVKVLDNRGKGMSGVKVEFVIDAGDGTVAPQIVVSDADGTAHVEWTLGQTAGDNTLRAHMFGSDSNAVMTVVGVAGQATGVSVQPRVMRLPAGTSTGAIVGAVVDQFGNATGVAATFVSRNPGLATVSATGSVAIVGSGGTTYIVVTGGGFTDSTYVDALKSGDSPCTGITTTVNLAVGDVMTTGFADNAICLSPTVTGGEYAFVPYFDSSVPTTVASVALSVFGATAPGPLGDVVPAFSRFGANAILATPVHDRIRDIEMREIPPRAAAARQWYAARQRAGGALMATRVPAVGDQMKLNASAFATACDQPVLRTGRVVAVTDKAVVVADVANPAGFTDAEYKSFGITFDTLVYPLDVASFGAPSDIDNNGGRIIIFFTHAVNEVDASVIGFFMGTDLLPKLGPFGSCAGSNVAEVINLVVPDPAGFSKADVMTYTVGTSAHEFQHLINQARRLYVNTSAAPKEERWLDEGLSHVAEELMFYRVTGLAPRQNIGSAVFSSQYFGAYKNFLELNFGRLREYLAAPDQQAPVGLDDLDDDSATRGAIWSYLRYAADLRSGTNETAFWHSLVNSNKTGVANLNEVIGTDSHLLMRDWTISIVLDDLVPTAAKYQQASWNLRGAIIGYSPSTVQLPISGSAATINLRAGGTAYARFGLAANQEAYVAAAGSGGKALPRHVLLALVRTK